MYPLDQNKQQFQEQSIWLDALAKVRNKVDVRLCGASLVVWAIKDGRDAAEAILSYLNQVEAVAAE